MKPRFTIFLIALLCTLSGSAQDVLQIYPAPEGADLMHDFAVRVRQAGGSWQTVDTYTTLVDEVRGGRHSVERASLAYFDFSGSVEVEVTCLRDSLQSVRVRPASCSIVPTVSGQVFTFQIARPCNLSVEVNGDIFHNLHLFSNPIDTTRPDDLSAPELIYFGPGLHRLPGDTLRVRSGQRVYVAGGAVVQGCISVEDAHDVCITGRGIVRLPGRAGLQVARSRRVKVEGLITTQCPIGGSDSVSVRGVKAISSYGWGDGMNVFASNHVEYDGVFCRTSDDCTTVYATRKGFKGGCSHISMRNSTLWADVAHPIFIGLHGEDPEHADTIEDVSYVNIDILDHREQQVDYQGCMAINAGDDVLVRRVLFEDIRVEDFRQGQLLNLRVCYNKKYCRVPGRGIEDITFRNVSYNGSHAELSIIVGYDSERRVQGVHFENLRINGTLITDDMPGKPAWYKTADMARIFVGEHVENVTFH